MSEVRIGLIGNSFASRAQLPALRWAGDNRVVALAGANEQKAQRTAAEWDIPHASADWRTLLELELDLVIITTPVYLHAEMVRAFLATPAAILCEKPFALNAQEAAELAALGRDRLCLLDHQLRWSPWRRKLSELVASGALGELWSARAQQLFGGEKRLHSPFTWWYDAARGGGMLGAIVSHMLDGLQVDLGRARDVRASLATYVPERPDANGTLQRVTADEHAQLWLTFESGVRAAIDANIMAPGSTGYLVEYVGSEATARVEQEDRLVLTPHGGEREVVAVAPPPTHAEFGLSSGGTYERMLPLYLRDVLACVRRGDRHLSGAATFADGLETMQVLDAARESQRSQALVRVAR